jgi:hypothetical protein
MPAGPDIDNVYLSRRIALVLWRISLGRRCIHGLRSVARCWVGSLLYDNHLLSAVSIMMAVVSMMTVVTVMAMMSLSLFLYHNYCRSY